MNFSKFKMNKPYMNRKNISFFTTKITIVYPGLEPQPYVWIYLYGHTFFLKSPLPISSFSISKNNKIKYSKRLVK